MFGNNPYDLVGPAMLAELHREVSAEPEGNTETHSTDELTLRQRVMAVISPRQTSLKLAAAGADGDCSEG